MFSELSLLTLLDLAIAIPVCCHIVLKKQAQAAAIGWIALVLLSPFVGAVVYWLFGINRVTSYARNFRHPQASSGPELGVHENPRGPPLTEQEQQLFQFAQSVHDFPYLAANNIEPLVNGDTAYPAMLSAIDSAMTSVALSVYIFDYDASGLSFIEALKAARKRGVAVRVLIDDVGARYSTRAVDRELSRDGVHCARFLPRRARFLPFLNLRNHRKSLIVDGRKAFLGGMNVRHGHVIAARPRHPVRDIHFAVAGPVIDQMNAVFEQDWKFAAGEDIDLPRWTSDSKASLQSDAVTRFVPDGPDDYFEKLQWLLLGAIAVSRHRICIMTPYFLPNEILSSALMVAALRGVGVEVIVPEISNLPFIDWAMRAAFGRLIEHGVKIYTTQPPFDHSKLMVVDGIWSLVGSSNWDQRSLRLNFEANLECFDDVLGARLEAYFDARRSMASTLHLSDFQNTSSLVRLRNNVAALLSPYL